MQHSEVKLESKARAVARWGGYETRELKQNHFRWRLNVPMDGRIVGWNS